MNIPINPNVFNGIKLDEDETRPMQTGKAKSWLGEHSWVSLPVTEKNKDDDTVTPAVEWCTEQFGRSGSRWFEKQKRFYFRDEKDMTMFILRWT